eukprot:3890680-Amphidinium_carterae.1
MDVQPQQRKYESFVETDANLEVCRSSSDQSASLLGHHSGDEVVGYSGFFQRQSISRRHLIPNPYRDERPQP